MSDSPYSREATLTDAQKRLEQSAPEPPRAHFDERPKVQYKVHPARRFFLRGPWEMAATIIIAVGVVMLMQPFVIELYTYSFVTILTGTVMFIIVSHFPER